MRIKTTRLMLLSLAVSALTISSCQKEEELLSTNSSLPPVTEQQQNADDEACGALLPTDPASESRMAQMETHVQEYIAANPDVVSGDDRTVVTIPVVFHVIYNTAEQNISDAQIQSQVAAL